MNVVRNLKLSVLFRRYYQERIYGFMKTCAERCWIEHISLCRDFNL